jgi:integrase
MSVVTREKVKGSGIWWLFINHNGIRKSKKIGRDRSYAERLAKILVGQLASGDLGVFQSHQNIKTVKEYADLWLSTTVPTTLKKSTQSDYVLIVNKHVSKAAFYNVPVSNVTRGEIKRFLRAKLSSGLAVSTVTHQKNVIGGIFNEAMDDDVITVNPAHGINLGRKKDISRKPKIMPFEVEEVNLLLDVFRNKEPRHHPLVLLLVSTGCRIGEAVGLQWRDVDFDERELLLRRNFVRNRIEDSTKNGLDRRVDITSQLVDCLRSLKKERAAEALQKGEGGIEKNWMFPSAIKTSGKPLNYDRWRKDIFYPTLEVAGLRKIRIHDLRHTYASIMISTGVNLVYIRDQLGHSSIKITADVYGHLLRGNAEKPVDILDTVLHPSAPHPHPKQKKELTENG